MGHAIHHIVVDEKVDRNSVMADIQEIARRDGDGYCSRLNWRDNLAPFSSKAEAEMFVESFDGRYEDIAVRFYDYSGATKTSKIAECETKITELVNAKKEYIAEHSVRKFQAKFIGCQKCGSKIAKDYLRGESCPVCSKDLRAESTLKKISWYGVKIAELYERIEIEKMKQKNKAKIKWLVKFEYHC